MSDTSVQDGNPVYKFAFTVGATVYRYTSASYDITDPNGTYTAESISMTNVIATNELNKGVVQVTLPRDNTLAGLFLGKVPEVATSLSIFRGHIPTETGDLYWRGRVTSPDPSGDTVTLNCENIFTSRQRVGLRARYQKPCRHGLYTTECGVVRSSFGVAASINTISGRTITINALSVSPELDATYFSGGIVELSTGELRTIESQNGLVLTLLYPFNDLTSGSPEVSCTLFPGCNRTTDHCKNRFNNLPNHGGFPHFPAKNPFRGNVTGSVA
ncbi:MAG: phage BR0599 family protein [Pseudomonadota bacterium]